MRDPQLNASEPPVAEWADLLHRQGAARRRWDPRLPELSAAETRRMLDEIMSDGPRVVVATEDDDLAGAAAACVDRYRPDDGQIAYFEPTTGRVIGLAVAGIGSDRLPALQTLLHEIKGVWSGLGATGAKVYWPALDRGVSKLFSAEGLYIDAYLCHGSPRNGHRPQQIPGLTLRRARPSDLRAACDLSMGVVDAHVAVSPFARRTPNLEAAFAARFECGAQRPPDRSIFLVAEMDRQLVGIAEVSLVAPEPTSDPIFTSSIIGYVDSLGVRADARRRGIGTALVEYAEVVLARQGAAEIFSLVSHFNVGARRFWSRRGYRPLWCLFQSHWLGGSAPASAASAEPDIEL